MKIHPLKLICIAATLVFACHNVLAKESASHQTLSFDPEVFEEQRRELLQELKTGYTYSEIEEADLKRVITALDQLGTTLAGVSRIEELAPEDRVLVYNLQSEINTTLTASAERSREICKRSVPVGSRFPQVTCKTVAEWERIRDNNQNFVRSIQRGRPPEPRGTGGR